MTVNATMPEQNNQNMMKYSIFKKFQENGFEKREKQKRT